MLCIDHNSERLQAAPGTRPSKGYAVSPHKIGEFGVQEDQHAKAPQYSYLLSQRVNQGPISSMESRLPFGDFNMPWTSAAVWFLTRTRRRLSESTFHTRHAPGAPPMACMDVSRNRGLALGIDG